jgi:hypothetical protein
MSGVRILVEVGIELHEHGVPVFDAVSMQDGRDEFGADARLDMIFGWERDVEDFGETGAGGE